MSLKKVITSVPLIGTAIRKMRGAGGVAPQTQHKSAVFENSSQYWEERYQLGGDSGAGSYNRLAAFKAEFLNGFVRDHGIRSVIEFGSGDGAQLALAQYPDYIGVDVSPTIIHRAKDKFREKRSVRFIHISEVDQSLKADLSLSLDVIYHLVEDEVFHRHMEQVFNAATKAVIIYASNEDRDWHKPHVKHRNFTRWVEKNRGDFVLSRHIPNIYPYDPDDSRNTSFADFYVFTPKAAES